MSTEGLLAWFGGRPWTAEDWEPSFDALIDGIRATGSAEMISTAVHTAGVLASVLGAEPVLARCVRVHGCVAEGEEAVCVCMLCSPPGPPHADDPVVHMCPKKTSLMHAAAAGGHISTIKFLLDLGCNVDFRDKILNRTPLTFACWRGHLDAVKYLVDVGGADPSAHSSTGFSCLMQASARGSLPVLEYLVKEKGVDPKAPDSSGNTGFTYACRGGNLDAAKWFVSECGIDPHAGETSAVSAGGTPRNPLYYSALTGRVEVVRWLVKDCGLDVNAVFDGYVTCLRKACELNYSALVRVLIHELGVNPNGLDSGTGLDTTPLEMCVSRGATASAAELLHHPDINVNKRLQPTYHNALFPLLSDLRQHGAVHSSLQETAPILAKAGVCFTAVSLLPARSLYPPGVQPIPGTDPDSRRWYRRSPWLHAITTAHAQRSAVAAGDDGKKGRVCHPVVEGVDAEVTALLLDRRLLTCRGPLVASVHIGFAMSFMHQCCEDEECPQVRCFLDVGEPGELWDEEDAANFED